MKKFILLILLGSINGFAATLHNFDGIKTAVLHGKSIHIIVDFSKCLSPSKVAEFMNVGIFTPNAIQVTNNSILASYRHFTLNNPQMPDKPIYEFIKYKITGNNVNLTVQLLDAINYQSIANKSLWNCEIDNGVKIYG